MVAAVSMVRDEADIVEATVRQMATQVDFLIVADNRSTDGTRDILEALSADLPLTVIDDPQMGYYQSRTITELANRAAGLGAEWIVPFDADEWFYSSHGRIGDVLSERTETIAFAASYNHMSTGEDDPDVTNPIERMGWRERDPMLLPKVACRALPGLNIEQGNHRAKYDGGQVTMVGDLFEIRHFRFRSPEQFERKIRNGAEAMTMTVFVHQPAHRWRRYGAVLKREGPAALERIFRECHYREDPRSEVVVEGKRRPPLLFDPVHGGAVH